MTCGALSGIMNDEMATGLGQSRVVYTVVCRIPKFVTAFALLRAVTSSIKFYKDTLQLYWASILIGQASSARVCQLCHLLCQGNLNVMQTMRTALEHRFRRYELILVS